MEELERKREKGLEADIEKGLLKLSLSLDKLGKETGALEHDIIDEMVAQLAADCAAREDD